MSKYLTQQLHSTKPPIELSSSFIGDLLLDSNTGRLYTKNLEDNIVALGDSFNKLVDFSIYSYGDTSNPVNYSFLRVYIDAFTNQLTIIDKISRLFLEDLQGYTQTNVLVDSWLAFSQSALTNVATNNFTLAGLVDVNLNANAATNNYVVTFRSSSNYKTQDYFKDKKYNYGYWELKPETSQIKAFDDVRYYIPEIPYQVFRGIRPWPADNMPGLLVNVRLFINADTNPVLGADLNGNGYGIYNSFVNSHVYTNTNLAVNYNVNPNITNGNAIHIDAAFAVSLSIFPLVKTNLLDAVFIVPVYIKNFTGDIYIPKSRYENGVDLVYNSQSSTRLLVLHINYTVSRTIITVIQKSANVEY
jgi:hypothetical protein